MGGCALAAGRTLVKLAGLTIISSLGRARLSVVYSLVGIGLRFCQKYWVGLGQASAW